MNLSGVWKYQFDKEDKGINEKWFKTTLLEEGFNFPGTTASNQLGDALEVDLEMSKNAVQCLRQHYRYVGVMWYQKEVVIPKEYENKSLQLFLERVMFESRVWINADEVGKQDSLSTPHLYDITKFIKPGQKNIITIRIDNRDIEKIGVNPSAYTDETQTIWNGIVGKLEIKTYDRVHISDVQVYPDINNEMVKVRVKVSNNSNQKIDFDLHSKIENNVNYVEKKVIEAKKQVYELTHKLSNCVLWDEFNPHLYTLSIEIKNDDIEDKKLVTFGMREFKAQGTQFTINGKKTFLRGTLDCCIFPLTGYPTMEREEWERILGTVKSYGLNHVRYHSWCPPEVAFTVADELGLYINVEGPMWMDTWNGTLVGQHPEHFKYLPEEAIRILNTYGNHPSFVMYANGNELNGDWQFMSNMIKLCKEHDERHVYTLTSNWDRKVDKEDDYFVAQTVDGVAVRGQYKLDEMVETTELHYNDTIHLRHMPIIAHEVGQYVVYPDMEEIKKYTGVLRPVNFETIRKDLENKNLIQYAKDYTLGSGALALNLYKAEIEAQLNTKGLGGFQLLDIHDFPGQSTATVGILNSFWESKGLTTPKEFNTFCSEVVPLVNMKKRIYEINERLNGIVKIANYGPKDLNNMTVSWTIQDDDKVLHKGQFKDVSIEQGELVEIGTIEAISFESLTSSKELKLKVMVEDTNYQNEWSIWVYQTEEVASDEVIVLNHFDDKAKKALEDGKNVLLLAKPEDVNNSTSGKFFPVFWSPVHFTSKDPCGMVINHTHPLFNDFPTGKYADLQWKDILEKSFSFVIDDLPQDFETITHVIPNFYNNKRSTNLFETKVLNGKLFACSIDLDSHLENRSVARQLKNSIYPYMSSEAFNPTNEMTINELETLFVQDNAFSKEKTDLALNKKAYSDSEKSLSYSASKGNDGNPTTSWCASDKEVGHYWMVDLGDVYEISGTKIKFSEEANYLYAIHTSMDGENFKVAVNQTGQTKKDQVRFDDFDDKCRYVKVIYNGIPRGIWASHIEVKVFAK